MDSLWNSFSQMTTAMGEPRGQAIALLIGLGALGVALLVLMMTRWGQVKPLSKCIVLSVFAHLLLMAYAYCIRTFNEFSVPGRNEVVQVTLVTPTEAEEPNEDSPTEESEPWNDFSVESPVDPKWLDPMRTMPDAPRLTERLREPSPLPFDSSQLPLVSTQADNKIPKPSMIAAAIPNDRRPAADGVPDIEVPEPMPAPEPIVEVAPTIESPRATRFDPTKEPVRTPPAELPADLLAGSPTIQRLTDLPDIAATADATTGTADELSRSQNREGPGANEILMPIPVASIPPAAFPNIYRATSMRRPADGSPLPETYRGRKATNRAAIIAQNGGSQATEAAVQAALAWLAEHQASDGRWDPDQHDAGRENLTLGHDRGGAGAQADTGITALAVLAFLGTGESHLEGEHKQAVQRGLEFLLRSQAADGNLAGNARLYARMYCHGMASLAISEAYAMTGDARLQPYVQRAMNYTIRAQNPNDGGWRYQPNDPGDMSQFGWQLMAVRSARLAGITIPETTQRGMRMFLQSVRAGRYGGLASYRPRGQASVTMTAEALACRLFMQADLNSAATQEATNAIMQQSPQSGAVNLYYWYYATIATFQLGGEKWETWNSQLQQRLLGSQQQSGNLAGSWSPDTVWGSYGGRVYSTAMAALCLEVYYRYLPVIEDGSRQ